MKRKSSRSPRGQKGTRHPIRWVLTVILLVVCWPLGAVFLFMQLTDLRDKRERMVPLEEFLSYSSDKSEEENQASISREKSTRRSITATKFVVPALTIVGSIRGTRDAISLARYGYDPAVLTDLLYMVLCLLLALLFAVYAVRTVRRMHRFHAYMDLIRRQPSVPIRLIVEKTGYTEAQIETDLEEMIRLLYFEKTAFLDRESGIFYRHT